jgi:hypothetical protein
MAPMTDSEISETTTEMTAAVVDEVEEADREAEIAAPIREVLERQLLAGQGLTGQLLDTATELGAAIAEAPARLIAEVRDGATLPNALGETGSALQATLVLAGDRIRSTLGGYLGGQATLPNAVIVGAAEVAVCLVRAQGNVTASAVDAAFTVATVATQGGDVRDAIDREWRELTESASSARGDVAQTFDAAREGVRQAVAVGAPV